MPSSNRQFNDVEKLLSGLDIKRFASHDKQQVAESIGSLSVDGGFHYTSIGDVTDDVGLMMREFYVLGAGCRAVCQPSLSHRRFI